MFPLLKRTVSAGAQSLLQLFLCFLVLLPLAWRKHVLQQRLGHHFTHLFLLVLPVSQFPSCLYSQQEYLFLSSELWDCSVSLCFMRPLCATALIYGLWGCLSHQLELGNHSSNNCLFFLIFFNGKWCPPSYWRMMEWMVTAQEAFISHKLCTSTQD